VLHIEYAANVNLAPGIELALDAGGAKAGPIDIN
jgi:hypothetical protein